MVSRKKRNVSSIDFTIMAVLYELNNIMQVLDRTDSLYWPGSIGGYDAQIMDEKRGANYIVKINPSHWEKDWFIDLIMYQAEFTRPMLSIKECKDSNYLKRYKIWFVKEGAVTVAGQKLQFIVENKFGAWDFYKRFDILPKYDNSFLERHFLRIANNLAKKM